MAKRKSGSSVRGKRVGKNGRHIPDSKIDFSDIPELSDQQLSSMRRVGRPPLGTATKLLIAVRIDPKILEALRKMAHRAGKGYQTLIHEILESYVDRRAA